MKTIPVDAARQIADRYRKDAVLFVAWDQASGKTEIVTWGREPPQKASAAAAGDMLGQMLRLGAGEVHEDFRREGEAARVVDALRRQLSAIREAIDEIVISEGGHAGVILLSNDSASHFDPEAKCQVYDRENFSPLGDALVALARLARGKA
jgi:hypothetical protein